MWCVPQHPQSKAYKLKEQDWACVLCGLDYSEHVDKGIQNTIENLPTKIIEEINFAEEMQHLFYRIGYRISQHMDLDHRLAIFKGGHGIDPRNCQVICRDCHRHKTAMERRC